MQDLQSMFLSVWQYSWARAIATILVSMVAAKVVDIVISRTLLVLARRTKTDLDERIVKALHRPVFVSVVLIGLFLATDILGIVDPHRFFVLGLLKTLAVFVWAGAVWKVTKTVLDGLGRVSAERPWARMIPLIENLAKLTGAALIIYMLLVNWDLDVKPWLASAGILSLAVGFAAKDTLANVFGGLFILADAPYQLGDFIVLDTGERGRVTQVGLRSTRLLTRDDIEVTLPNAVVANAKIVNETGGPSAKARITVNIGVAYGSDVDQVRRVLLDAAVSVELVTDDPEPRVRFTSFGDSALLFRLLCWIDEPVLRGQALDAVNTAVYKRFNEEGIQIPFPQQDVYIKQLPAGSA